MNDNSHRLFSTPVSVADGLKRGDRNTWKVLLIAAAIAMIVVLAINLFVDKTPIKWPGSPAQQPASESEPRTFDVAPPGGAPPRT